VTTPADTSGTSPGYEQVKAVALAMTALAKRLVREAAGLSIDPMRSVDVQAVKDAEAVLRG
jgi:hypothetical protein